MSINDRPRLPRVRPDPVGGCHDGRLRARREVTAIHGWNVACHRVAFGDPSFDPAVEQRKLRVPEIVERKEQAGGGRRVRCVHDDARGIGDPERLEARTQLVGGGQLEIEAVALGAELRAVDRASARNVRVGIRFVVAHLAIDDGENDH